MKEGTLDLSESMRKIIRRCFTSAIRVIDRFHIQKLTCDAVQEIRIGHRWEAIQEETDARQEAGKSSVRCPLKPSDSIPLYPIIQPLDSNIKIPLSDEVRRGFFVDSIPVLTGGIKSFLL